MTQQTTDAPAKRKTGSLKPPIKRAEDQIVRQIKETEESSSLPAELKSQLLDWLNGLKRAMQTREQVVDAGRPPAEDSLHGQLIALGRRQRLATAAFLNATSNGSETSSSSVGV